MTIVVTQLINIRLVCGNLYSHDIVYITALCARQRRVYCVLYTRCRVYNRRNVHDRNRVEVICRINRKLLSYYGGGVVSRCCFTSRLARYRLYGERYTRIGRMIMI